MRQILVIRVGIHRGDWIKPMRALICGVGGQDGTYLAQLLLTKGYDVWGTSRNVEASTFDNLKSLGLRQYVKVVSLNSCNFNSVLTTIDTVRPDEIYLLSGQTSVGLSFKHPTETLESIAFSTLNFLEAIRCLGIKAKIYNASSSECFGDIGMIAADENTPFRPRSPYAIAKVAAHSLVANYRDTYGLFACNGILFNHESQFRPKHFVTQKIISTAVRIAGGSYEKLNIGNINITRDWGWAPEYVDAMWRMLQQENAEDFVIATGESNTLEKFIGCTFECLNLNWKDHTTIDMALFRPMDLIWSQGNANKAKNILQWEASSTMRSVIRRMLDAELKIDVNL